MTQVSSDINSVSEAEKPRESGVRRTGARWMRWTPGTLCRLCDDARLLLYLGPLSLSCEFSGGSSPQTASRFLPPSVFSATPKQSCINTWRSTEQNQILREKKFSRNFSSQIPKGNWMQPIIRHIQIGSLSLF